jgi:hypothetical protein
VCVCVCESDLSVCGGACGLNRFMNHACALLPQIAVYCLTVVGCSTSYPPFYVAAFSQQHTSGTADLHCRRYVLLSSVLHRLTGFYVMSLGCDGEPSQLAAQQSLLRLDSHTQACAVSFQRVPVPLLQQCALDTTAEGRHLKLFCISAHSPALPRPLHLPAALVAMPLLRTGCFGVTGSIQTVVRFSCWLSCSFLFLFFSCVSLTSSLLCSRLRLSQSMSALMYRSYRVLIGHHLCRFFSPVLYTP